CLAGVNSLGRPLIARSIRARHPLSAASLQWSFAVVLLISMCGSFLYALAGWPQPVVFTATAVGATALSLWREADKFLGLGLMGADRSVEKGIDYARALRLCQNSLEFAGLGADKLTSCAEFAEAIRRCHRPDRPIKFLLARPDSEFFRTAARQADQRADE